MSQKFCTAPDKRCTAKATRKGVRDVYEGSLCYTCWDRIRNQNTYKCSAGTCKGRVLKDQSIAKEYKGRTKPAPWCRRHEHLALSAEVIGQGTRAQVLAGYLKGLRPDWDTQYGCWFWQGEMLTSKSEGEPYGSFWRKPIGSWSAHRLAYHLFYSGHGYSSVIDHRCGNRLCVSPLHLQAIPRRRNDALQGKRANHADIIEYWYEDKRIDLMPEELIDFARSNDLPLRSPEADYSKWWEQGARVRGNVADTLEDILQALSKASGPTAHGTRV